MKKLVFVCVLLCVVSGPLNADVHQWVGGTDWSNGWGGTPPDEYDTAKINNLLWGQDPIEWALNNSPIIGGVNGTQNISIGNVFIAEGGAALSPMHMTVAQGGTFNVLGAGGTAQGQINIGYQDGAWGGMTIDGGTAIVNGSVHVGWGGDGTLIINGGSMTVLAIDIGGNLGTGIITVNSGQLIVAGNVVDQLQEYKNNGDLIGTIFYDAQNDRTVVTPEPASIALLSLGLMFLKKK